MSNSPTRTPINRRQLSQVFKDPQTLRAFEQMLDTFTNVQNGSLTFSSGDLKPFAGGAVQDGWLKCDGSAVSRTVYSSLFGAIGTTWGPGDGSTTFNLPPSGVALIGANATYPLGSTGGAASVILSVNQLPAHSHALTDPGHGHGITDPGHNHAITDPGHLHSGGNIGTGGTGAVGTGIGSGNTGTSTTGITINTGTTGVTVNNGTTGITVQSTGLGAAVPTMSPYAAITWLIKI